MSLTSAVRLVGLRADDSEHDFGEFRGIAMSDGKINDIITGDTIMSHTPNGWQTKNADTFVHAFIVPMA